MFKSSRITPAFRTKTFANFDITGKSKTVVGMYKCAKKYTDNFREICNQENNWLLLTGEPGSGKTHLSMAIANHVLNQAIPVLYFQHVEGLGELKDCLRKQDDIFTKMEKMKKSKLLIWDDLFWGKKDPSNFELEVAFEVLNYRYLNLLPTIITTNRTHVQLLEIDNTIGSRIIERAKGHIVLIQDINANYRLTKIG